MSTLQLLTILAISTIPTIPAIPIAFATLTTSTAFITLTASSILAIFTTTTITPTIVNVKKYNKASTTDTLLISIDSQTLDTISKISNTISRNLMLFLEYLILLVLLPVSIE
jgi:hypothetical protein